MEENKTVLQGGDGRATRTGFEPPTLKLITTGRTTGLPHIVIVRFVFYEGAYFVMGGSSKSDWFLNALVSRGGKVRQGHYVQTVACEQFFDKDLVRKLFRKKYGPGIVKEWYSGSQIRLLKLTPTALRNPGKTPKDALSSRQGLSEEYAESAA
jgi:hypothetical protein